MAIAIATFYLTLFTTHLVVAEIGAPDLACEDTKINTLVAFNDNYNVPRTFISSGDFYWTLPFGLTPFHHLAYKLLRWPDAQELNIFAWYNRWTIEKLAKGDAVYKDICAQNPLGFKAFFALQERNKTGYFHRKIFPIEKDLDDNFIHLIDALPENLDSLMAQEVERWEFNDMDFKKVYSNVIYLATVEKKLSVLRCFTKTYANGKIESSWIKEKEADFNMFRDFDPPIWTMFQFGGNCYYGKDNFIWNCPCIGAKESYAYRLDSKSLSCKGKQTVKEFLNISDIECGILAPGTTKGRVMTTPFNTILPTTEILTSSPTTNFHSHHHRHGFIPVLIIVIIVVLLILIALAYFILTRIMSRKKGHARQYSPLLATLAFFDSDIEFTD